MKQLRRWGFTVAALAAWPGAALAQTAEGVELPEAMTLMDMLKNGGWPMVLLGLMSVVAVALILYFFAVFRVEAVMPREYLLDVRQMLKNNRLEEADIASRKNESPAAAIVLAGVDYIKQSSRPEPSLLKEIMEGEGARQAELIQHQSQYLLDIGVIAPMVGLLGTVMGMLKAFNSVASDIAMARPMVLAEGVSQALTTTAVGLIVAVPAMIFYSYFRGRIAKIIARMEMTAAELMNVLTEHCHRS